MSTPHRLKKPIARKNFTIEEIALDEPTGDTMLLVEQYRDTPIRLSLELIAHLALVDGKRGEISFADVRKMHAEDIEALGELLNAVLPDGPTTGATA